MATVQTRGIWISWPPKSSDDCANSIRQVGFASSHGKRTQMLQFLRLGRSYSAGRRHREGGFRWSSQAGPSSPVEDCSEEKTGLLLGTERNSSSSSQAVAFNLIPESGEVEIKVSKANVPNSKDDVTPQTENVETIARRLTYNVVFVTAEAAPYSKTGGLGDVCGSLPIALAHRGHRVMVVCPRYLVGGQSDKKYANAVPVGSPTKVYCFGGVHEVTFYHEYRAGVDWVFVDHPSYHRPGTPYGDGFGAFGDNQFRFTLLCHAACEAPLVLALGGYTYGEKCLFLANDWHAGLVPVLIAAKYRPYGVYKDARTITVIHNLAHQGVEPAETYQNLGLPPEWYGALVWVYPTWARTHALDTGEAVNILKAAIVTSDRILTVSKGYSWEITTPEGGCGLNELLGTRSMVLNGITNGIDVNEWDPYSDGHISAHYSTNDLSGKAQCKIALQEELGLPVRPECPLIGFIGRLDFQKGVDILLAATPEILQDDVQFVICKELYTCSYIREINPTVDINEMRWRVNIPADVQTLSSLQHIPPPGSHRQSQVMLGSGERQYEDWMRQMESQYKDKFRGWVGFNVPISHRITAGCDILVMPSRFEPCGLNQLYAMRYGTIPVVHGTGGLKDTVKNYNPYAREGNGEGTGWTFSPLSKENLLAALRLAIRTYREYKPSWEGLMKRGMERDCSWNNAAVHYEQVFEWAFIDPPYSK